jgi:prepilin-type N-terminal cleavage/methylation domain-containing protein
MTTTRLQLRRGFTLIELLLAMVVGLIVLSTVTGYVRSTDRTITGTAMRDDYARKARFIGLTMRRDIGEAGVGIESLRGWGTVAVFNDTIVVLKVPFEPNADPAYAVALSPNPPTTTTGTSNSASNCGNACFRLRRSAPGVTPTLEAGMVARVQQGSIRKFIAITNVVVPGGATDSFTVQFRSMPAAGLLRRPSLSQNTGGGWSGILNNITTTNTSVQRLDMVAYWRDASNNLWRATRINPGTGAFEGEIVATGCTSFEASIVFQDGGTANNADSTIANRWYTDVNAVVVRATLQSDYSDQRINNGAPLSREYVWRVQPRNLLYERNRDN